MNFSLATIGVSASIATKFMITCLPNMLPLVIAVMVVDVSSQFTPRTRIAEAVHTVNYGILFW